MFVVIMKTVGDLNPRPAEHKKSHPLYPVECKEYEDFGQAHLENPEKSIMTLEAYNGFKEAMNLQHGTIAEPSRKPWWKFWTSK